MRTMRLIGVALILAPAMVLAQAQAKPAEKKAAAKPAMQHDMSTMSHDTGMKHDMAGMGQGAGMGEMKSGWNELDAFHTLLMSVWHPALKDSLTMARTLAPTLAASAVAWEKSKGPAACDNAAARKALPGIVTDAKTYANVAGTKANDAAVKAALKKVHDGFETVGKPCMQAAMKAKGGMGMGMGRMMGQKSGWKEFDALHTLVMSVSAAANKGDFKPAREKAVELTRLAEALAASKGPMQCDNTEARKWIPVAVRHAKSLTEVATENGSDAAVKKAFELTHKEFQKVARPCLMGTPAMSDRDRARLQSANEARLQLNHPAVQKKP